MKIIREGRLPEKQVHECTCRYCSTVFEFERGEAKHVPARDQRDTDELHIDCPLCKRVCITSAFPPPRKP